MGVPDTVEAWWPGNVKLFVLSVRSRGVDGRWREDWRGIRNWDGLRLSLRLGFLHQTYYGKWERLGRDEFP